MNLLSKTGDLHMAEEEGENAEKLREQAVDDVDPIELNSAAPMILVDDVPATSSSSVATAFTTPIRYPDFHCLLLSGNKSKFVSPKTLFSLPKADGKRNVKKRRCQKSEILMSYPYQKKKSDEADEKTAKEARSKNEDWIQCNLCQGWAHEACTSYSGIGFYVCDNCQSECTTEFFN